MCMCGNLYCIVIKDFVPKHITRYFSDPLLYLITPLLLLNRTSYKGIQVFIMLYLSIFITILVSGISWHYCMCVSQY
jgi:predicted permease